MRVLFDDRHLYVGAVLYDPGGADALRARDLRRDFGTDEADLFGVHFDPFGDGRTAVAFITNASGAQRDLQSLDDQGRLLAVEWDAVWQVRTALTDGGWTAEVPHPVSPSEAHGRRTAVRPHGRVGVQRPGGEDALDRHPELRPSEADERCVVVAGEARPLGEAAERGMVALARALTRADGELDAHEQFERIPLVPQGCGPMLVPDSLVHQLQRHDSSSHRVILDQRPVTTLHCTRLPHLCAERSRPSSDGGARRPGTTETVVRDGSVP